MGIANEIISVSGSTIAAWIAVVISIIVGTITIHYARKTNEYAKKIAYAQFQINHFMEIEKKLSYLESFMKELDKNLKIIEQINNDSNKYKNGEVIFNKRFSIICLQSLLKQNASDIKGNLIERLFDVQDMFIVLNNLFDTSKALITGSPSKQYVITINKELWKNCFEIFDQEKNRKALEEIREKVEGLISDNQAILNKKREVVNKIIKDIETCIPSQ